MYKLTVYSTVVKTRYFSLFGRLHLLDNIATWINPVFPCECRLSSAVKPLYFGQRAAPALWSPDLQSILLFANFAACFTNKPLMPLKLLPFLARKHENPSKGCGSEKCSPGWCSGLPQGVSALIASSSVTEPWHPSTPHQIRWAPHLPPLLKRGFSTGLNQVLLRF